MLDQYSIFVSTAAVYITLCSINCSAFEINYIGPGTYLYFYSHHCVYLYMVSIISGPGQFTIMSVTTYANLSTITVTYMQVSHAMMHVLNILYNCTSPAWSLC